MSIQKVPSKFATFRWVTENGEVYKYKRTLKRDGGRYVYMQCANEENCKGSCNVFFDEPFNSDSVRGRVVKKSHTFDNCCDLSFSERENLRRRILERAATENTQNSVIFQQEISRNDAVHNDGWRVARQLMATALLPPHRIEEAVGVIEGLAENCVEAEKPKKLIAYFRNEWIMKVTPQSFSVHGQAERTNNSQESLNRCINRTVKPQGSAWDSWDYEHSLPPARLAYGQPPPLTTADRRQLETLLKTGLLFGASIRRQNQTLSNSPSHGHYSHHPSKAYLSTSWNGLYPLLFTLFHCQLKDKRSLPLPFDGFSLVFFRK
ncbi:hypothetical protein LSTR_LSTR014320 [Laodelphax striatellus]|uniref:FLYWCH-type domain-containing protein n=1 Tax=Laodelphax striatellus TaxID=195883 RepID=A0A482WXX4_LAOST|nr:hypothetical protein LSTR_LSTR014320 [Laodelphax striatellus]